MSQNDESGPLNMFMSRDGVEAWAQHLDLYIEAIHDGDKPHTPLPHPIVLEDGSIMEDKGNLLVKCLRSREESASFLRSISTNGMRESSALEPPTTIHVSAWGGLISACGFYLGIAFN